VEVLPSGVTAACSLMPDQWQTGNNEWSHTELVIYELQLQTLNACISQQWIPQNGTAA